MKKPVTVEIKMTRNAQPYTVTIFPVGKGEPYKIKQRYADKRGAKRGALRALDARTWPSLISGRPFYFSGGYLWVTPKGNPIKFVHK